MACQVRTSQGTKWVAVASDGIVVGEYYTLTEALRALGKL